MNTAKVESRENDASSLIVHSRPPKSPRSPPAAAALTTAVRSSPLVHRSVLSPDESLEIASYLQRQPSSVATTTRTRRRAVSVPPRPPSGSGVAPPSRPSVPRWFPSSSGRYSGGTARRYVPAPVGLPASLAHLPPSDAVVGVAHTSLYGDIVIGIPYKKRFMFNAQV